MLAWLDRLARARGIKADVAAILDAAASAQPGELARLFAAAHAIHAWKREMQNAAIRR
jgi:hypothetical protein